MTKNQKSYIINCYFNYLKNVDFIKYESEFWSMYGSSIALMYIIKDLIPEYRTHPKVSISYIDKVFWTRKEKMKNDL